jgi:hypothetical protein
MVRTMPSQHSSSPSSEQHWFELARSVVNEAAGAGHGGHEKIYAAYAETHGLHVQTIKRALTSFRFVSKVAAVDPLRARRLQTMPLTAVGTLARWYAYDRRAAFAAMDRCEAGEISARQLDAEEKQARKRNASFTAQISKYAGLYELDAFDTAFAYLLKDWRSEPSGPFDGFGSAPFSRTFRHRQNDSLCLVQVPGPFEVQGDWEKERNTIMLSAVGAVALGYRVLIVVPEGRNIKRLLDDWLAQVRPHEPKITIIETQLRQLQSDPGDDAAAS